MCAICPRYRRTEQEWLEPLTIRARRKSLHPDSRIESATYARNFKRDEEARLREDVAQAKDEKRAIANAVRFGRICDGYRAHLKQAGKRHDRAESLIANIEAFYGRERDAAAIGWDESGASHLAEKTKNPILIAKMMGDTNVQTVMRHYFNLDLEFMAEMVTGWSVPAIAPDINGTDEHGWTN